jgi:type II secretory pathway component PulF
VSPALYAVFGVIGTFFFLVFAGGALYFAVELMRTIRAATKAIEIIGPLLKGEELTRLTNAFILMGKQGAEMLKKMEALDKTIGLFYSFAVARGELDASARVASEPQPSGGGRFVGYDESKAAAREAAVQAQEER